MCGIFGVLKLSGRDASGCRNAVEHGTRLLHHRGPDGRGVIASDMACVGHTRLAILDVPNGAQPMWSASRRCLITYNGEVYNYKVLRIELERAGYVFTTDCDTEVVLAAFEEWGVDCLGRLRGMFAFCVVDTERKKALIARDRFGQKPVVYTIKNDELWFSSELEALYRVRGPFGMSCAGLTSYLKWLYIPAPLTIYNNVCKLKPASFLDVDFSTGKVKEGTYWRPHFNPTDNLSVDEWEEKLDDALRESVAAHLCSDVPFGAFLSGGVDSSLVVSYMAEILTEPVSTFSIGFPHSEFCELTYAREAAKLNATNHAEETLSECAMDIMSELTRHYGEPFGDASAIPTYAVAQMASKKVKMVLSGDGGDELFGGYPWYSSVLKEYADSRRATGSRLRSVARSVYRMLRRIITNQRAEIYDLYEETAGYFSHQNMAELLQKPMYPCYDDYAGYRRRHYMEDEMSFLGRMQTSDIDYYLPGDILTKVDISTMASSIECRAPFLDEKVCDVAFAMPEELRLKPDDAGENGYQHKYLPRRLCARKYSDAYAFRKKQGFSVPLAIWLDGEAGMNYLNRLCDESPLDSLLQMDNLRQFVRNDNPCIAMHVRRWGLVVLDEWARQHTECLSI